MALQVESFVTGYSYAEVTQLGSYCNNRHVRSVYPRTVYYTATFCETCVHKPLDILSGTPQCSTTHKWPYKFHTIAERHVRHAYSTLFTTRLPWCEYIVQRSTYFPQQLLARTYLYVWRTGYQIYPLLVFQYAIIYINFIMLLHLITVTFNEICSVIAPTLCIIWRVVYYYIAVWTERDPARYA
jgi:hypothetical protein